MAAALMLVALLHTYASIPRPITVLVFCGDGQSEAQYNNTDAICIVSLNTLANEIKLVSIMRDLWLKDEKIPFECKVNELCKKFGPQTATQILASQFGVEFCGYVYVDMQMVADVIDLAGGVNIHVDKAEKAALNKGLFDISSYSDMQLLEETGKDVHLNGNQAVAYARIRQIDSDFARTARQREVIMSLLDTLKRKKVSELVSVLVEAMKRIETDIEIRKQLQYILWFFEAKELSYNTTHCPFPGTFDADVYNGTYRIAAKADINKRKLRQYLNMQ